MNNDKFIEASRISLELALNICKGTIILDTSIKLKCECGSEIVKSTKHSEWCPKYEN